MPSSASLPTKLGYAKPQPHVRGHQLWAWGDSVLILTASGRAQAAKMSEVSASPEALRVIYVTCASLDEAERIGDLLVTERLVACVNLLPGMTSIYRWKGNIERAQEVVLVAKTTLTRTTAVIERVIALHSYEVPCVVALPILDGNPAYLAWLRAAVEPDKLRP